MSASVGLDGGDAGPAPAQLVHSNREVSKDVESADVAVAAALARRVHGAQGGARH